jgi:gliding motility-associated-like protein
MESVPDAIASVLISNQYKDMKKNFFIFLITLLIQNLSAQNEANIWYFCPQNGLDFSSGMPLVLTDGQATYGSTTSTISDSLGNYLFSSDWGFVYNEYGIMDNGEGMVYPGISGYAIVKWPGRHGVYFLFNSAYPGYPETAGLKYSIIDFNLNNGLGTVSEKNIPIEDGWDASDRISIVKKENSDIIWVIVRKNINDALAAFRVDENGLNPNPVISPMPDQGTEWKGEYGTIKISPNKRFSVSSYINDGIEICLFNSSNGAFEYLYTFDAPQSDPEGGVMGMEFSPDSKYLYVCYDTDGNYGAIYQYDLQLFSDQEQFKNSALLIGKGNAFGMQLARDGKIYFTPVMELEDANRFYVSVIHNPWIRGEGCMFENNVLNLPNKIDSWTFPNILVDYLLRFEWAGEPCQGYPIHFKPNFIPTPQTIQWDFNDGPGSTSWQLSPSYTFKNPGVHEVKVDVWYPSGRYEHTSREIEISLSPLPLLGNDTLICHGASITLNANCVADFFSWSTNQFGVSSITVSDSGTYWVRGRFNDSGCEGYDTIHIGFHQPTIIDEANLQIIPTTCNGASGSITGLTALGSTPYAYRWKDLSEVEYGTDIDVFGLPAGQYVLHITDGNGCENVSEVYTIEDAGNLQVLDIELTQPHCGRPDGEIVVHGFNPSGAALQYSIDDGATYQADSVFSGLVDLDYVVRVTDGNGCFGFFIDNPVHLVDIPGPQVTQVNVTDETDFLGNGSIEILASGSTPVIYYSIDGGTTWQLNDGNFYNLQSRIYSLQIKDENGCDTTFTVEIQNVILTYLHAVTGEEGICEDSTALIPVNVDNFINVADFHLKLGYNADNLECEGFANVNVQLLDSLTGWVDPIAGDIHLAWNSPTSVTFPGTEKVADLVFTTKNPGQGELAWYTGETESYFTNSSGNPIPAEFSTGEVKIYEPPEIILDQSKTFCTGQFASLMSIAVGNQPPLTFRWIYPTGDTTSNDPIFFSVSSSDAGLYTLLATDRVGCTDQKSIELIVSENPVAAFHGTDTLEIKAGEVLDAGEGMTSYRWNPGDTTQSIVIQAEGMYKVEMKSPVGCFGTDSVYVKLTSEEIPDFEIYVPNAFSPNGDGINDNFKIIFPHSTFNLQHSTLSIFNRWGEEIFKSTDITQGWDGKKNGNPCQGGVYVYKIVFLVDGVPGNQERVGTVMLVR